MKILYISKPAYADCDFPLIRAFQKKGIDVTYLILLPCYSLRSTLVDIKKQIPKTGIFLASEYTEFKQYESYMDMSKVYVSNRIRQKGYSWSAIKENYLLWKFIRSGEYDIIHYDSYFGGLRKLYYHIKSNWVTTFHDPFPHTGEGGDYIFGLYKYVVNHSKGVVLLNKNQELDFCKKYNVSQEKILVNRLGIYDNIRQFVKDSNSKENNILFFGRISPYKGIEYLCEAMLKVHQVIPDATLTIAGGGEMYFDIEPYLKLGYIEVHNHYIGMEELADYLSKCTISVCPYTDATQSGVIMTSFSLGKPVIATEVGGLSETIEHGRNGLLVPPRDSESLADAIISLLSSPERICSMTKNIFEEYDDGEKSWSVIAGKYIDYYKQISECI